VTGASRLVALAVLVGHAVAAPAAAQELTLRVVTFNLLHGGLWSELSGNDAALEERLALVREALRALDADVVALQEASTGPRRGHVAGRLAAALGYHHAWAPAAVRPFESERARQAVAATLRFTEGPAILSRFPIVDRAAHAVPYCGRPLDARVALFAELLTPVGRLPTFSVHVSGDACQARAVAEVVRARRRGRTALVLGDFNAIETAAPIRALTGAGFLDAFRLANPGRRGYTAGQRVREPRPTASRRIDYVFLVPGAAPAAWVRSSRVVLREPRLDGAVLWPSDHYGVLAEIVLDGRSRVAGGEPGAGGPGGAAAGR
jgi:endonuclease/exonuclease/phosphatase family metal-dependent hydrolase